MFQRAVMLLALTAGCAATSPAPNDPAAFDEDGDVPMAGRARARAPAAQPQQATVQPPDTDPEPARPPTPIPIDAAGVIPRPDLLAVLDRGPGQFLVGIVVEPVFRGKQFAGWEIVSFDPADARFGAAPLEPGDIVTAVNARSISRPRQLQAVWDELRAAQALIIEGERGGQAFALRYDIAP